MAEVNRCDQCHEYAGCCLCYGDPEPDDEPRERDCLNCGVCEGCIQQSIAFAEEMNDSEPMPVPEWDGDYEE